MFSPQAISYCANVHPGNTRAEVSANLERFTLPLARRLPELAVGLWLPRNVLNELAGAETWVDQTRATLADAGVTCYTLNAFPFGDFHAERVKEQVYLPDWTTLARLEYTCQAAEVLARLLPEGADGSISTSPCAFKRLHPWRENARENLNLDGHSPFFPRLQECARYLAQLKQRTGRHIRLALEPEPCCWLETTPETISFFQTLWTSCDRDSDLDAVRAHLGICYDVCHQAVEFEDAGRSIRSLHEAGIILAKIHLTNALELADPTSPEARAELARYVEPRYLHQTMARHPDGRLLIIEDITLAHTLKPPEDWLECPSWRVHFHVPVHRETLGQLVTTRSSLRDALLAARDLPYAPHLEVETYTWGVLPSTDSHLSVRQPDFDLIAGLHAEMVSVQALISELSLPSPSCP